MKMKEFKPKAKIPKEDVIEDIRWKRGRLVAVKHDIEPGSSRDPIMIVFATKGMKIKWKVGTHQYDGITPDILRTYGQYVGESYNTDSPSKFKESVLNTLQEKAFAAIEAKKEALMEKVEAG